MKYKYLETIFPVVKGLRDYHKHSVVGLEHIPEGPVIIAVTHSLATYDIALLSCAIYEKYGRIPRPLADRFFFKWPYLAKLVEELGAKEGSSANAKELLEAGEIITVAPGGMREALRPSTERYQIRWEKRKGFARLAVETKTPVVLAVCPKADDLYDVYPSKLTKWAYLNLKLPLIFARGIGLSPLPRPIHLTHFLSPPMLPPEPSANPATLKRQITTFHIRLVRHAERLIGKAIAHRD